MNELTNPDRLGNLKILPEEKSLRPLRLCETPFTLLQKINIPFQPLILSSLNG